MRRVETIKRYRISFIEAIDLSAQFPCKRDLHGYALLLGLKYQGALGLKAQRIKEPGNRSQETGVRSQESGVRR